VIPTASADASYFSSNGHRFGYGGIQQVNANTGLVIFSLWDQGGCDQDVDPNCNNDDIATTIACGNGVTCTDFGGEGTGRKSYFTIQNKGFPKIDEEYYFVTQAAYLGDRKMQYTGYFFMDGEWRLLSRIQVSTNAYEEWSLGGLYSFVEQWTAVDTLSERSALYGPSFMAETDGKNFVQVNSATFTHGTVENHEHVNAWQEEGNGGAVGIATGGDVERDVAMWKTFQYPQADPYPLLSDFVDRISCLNEASITDEIEHCLRKTSEWSPLFAKETFNNGLGVFVAKDKNAKVNNKKKTLRLKSATHATTVGHDLTTGVTELRLSLDLYSVNYADGDSFVVEYSTDGALYENWENFVFGASAANENFNKNREWIAPTLGPLQIEAEKVFIRIRTLASGGKKKIFVDNVLLEAKV
jgi:hypothetical protein